jgi:hypothetical protein
MSFNIRFRLVPVCAAVSTLWALLVLIQINSGMARLHKSYQPGYGITALSGQLFHGPTNVARILSTWMSAGSQSPVMDWREWYAAIDIVLAVSYVTLLWWLLNRGLRNNNKALRLPGRWNYRRLSASAVDRCRW